MQSTISLTSSTYMLLLKLLNTLAHRERLLCSETLNATLASWRVRAYVDKIERLARDIQTLSLKLLQEENIQSLLCEEWNKPPQFEAKAILQRIQDGSSLRAEDIVGVLQLARHYTKFNGCSS